MLGQRGGEDDAGDALMQTYLRGNNDRDDQDTKLGTTVTQFNVNVNNHRPRHAPVQRPAFRDVARLPRESN